MAREEYFKWAESLLDPSKTFEKPEALADIKVVELCTLILGPSLPAYLSELGATVFKVELPGMGDTMRSLTPFAKFFNGAAMGWLKEARNKYHLAIDVRVEEGAELFRELVKRADVVVENLRAGTMDRWGIGYRQLRKINPGLIYIALNGFGQWGPYLERPSYDAIAQSESGMAWISGFPDQLPMKAGIWLADYYGGLVGAVGVLAALAYRDKTGKGQFIEYSQAENLMRAMDWTWLYQHFTGKMRERYGNRDVSICPADIVPDKDGTMVAIGAATDRQFQSLCQAMGKPELAQDPRFATHLERLKEENAVELLSIIRSWVAEKSYAEIDALAGKYGFGAHKVSDGKDHVEDEHLRARNFTYRVDDPIYGEFYEEGIAPKLSETPGRIKWAGKPVGFDNEYVLKRFLGLKTKKIKYLKEKNVIGKWVDVPPGRKPPEGWDGKSGVLLA
ncbi:Crotonobetainyl-CoA:carnitine CoA-transferase CaiB [Desulfacinum hydrothermale DSM 13146]|uniref:Crotonobetainyl-CoA:carnitine CoA-transferase CaiB n=1 Tax=Desulfacinum hydrothermale DSM 13146 TaxID=1121390 RepID=A0A1W1XTB4_9BACT|nr:CoA transferase [Desulfacinum hydrothermale]SMC27127.1 Crotonobetainyl-CoA:carnitine CoA-transferase CaiB [Desulfacinum hydrothermale DSM 13146]